MKGRILSLVAIAFSVAFLLWFNRPVTLPAYFDTSLTYPAALERARQSGKPVFVYASADWCGPCREFKRSALRDRRIAEWLTTRTIPVYLDVTSPSSPGAGAGASLGVTSIPAIFLVRDGEPVGRHEGVLDAGSLLDWLEALSREPPTPAG
jgi:thiol:disulfide interchange protein